VAVIANVNGDHVGYLRAGLSVGAAALTSLAAFAGYRRKMLANRRKRTECESPLRLMRTTPDALRYEPASIDMYRMRLDAIVARHDVEIEGENEGKRGHDDPADRVGGPGPEAHALPDPH
jgi:hypothetical protein